MRCVVLHQFRFQVLQLVQQISGLQRRVLSVRGEAGRYISIHPLSNRESAREHGWGSEHPISVLSRGGSLLPSIYADARYVDDVIVSQADCTLHTGPTEGVNVYKNLDTEPTQVVITFVDGITVDQTGSYCSNWVQSEQQAAGVSSAPVRSRPYVIMVWWSGVRASA